MRRGATHQRGYGRVVETPHASATVEAVPDGEVAESKPMVPPAGRSRRCPARPRGEEDVVLPQKMSVFGCCRRRNVCRSGYQAASGNRRRIELHTASLRGRSMVNSNGSPSASWLSGLILPGHGAHALVMTNAMPSRSRNGRSAASTSGPGFLPTARGECRPMRQ